MTIDSDKEYFQVGGGTLWDGITLYSLYGQACTPWEWQPKLKTIAEDMGMDLFSTAFDVSSVDFLDEMGVSVHKIASFEIGDLPLIERMARTGKPLIMSTGMASLGDIEDAVRTARQAGAEDIALLKCTSAYPAPPDEMNLRTIPHLGEAFGVPAGLSDHSLGFGRARLASSKGNTQGRYLYLMHPGVKVINPTNRIRPVREVSGLAVEGRESSP